MTANEFKYVAAELRTVYSWANLLQNKEAMEIWYRHLKDLPDGSVTAIVSKWIETHSNPPTIADIRTEATTAISGELPTWADGWGKVQKAIGRWGYMNKAKALATMDEITQKAVNALGWESICASENPEATRAQFRMAYESYAKRETAQRQITEKTRTQITDISGANAIGDTIKMLSKQATWEGDYSDE